MVVIKQGVVPESRGTALTITMMEIYWEMGGNDEKGDSALGLGGGRSRNKAKSSSNIKGR